MKFSKYNEIFCLRMETINDERNNLEKMKDDNIIILQPKLKELMSDKIYKLEIGKQYIMFHYGIMNYILIFLIMI